MPARTALRCHLDRYSSSMGSFRIKKTQLDGEVGGSYTLRYIVHMDDEASPISVVISGQGISGSDPVDGTTMDALPALWDTYVYAGDSDTSSYCKEISVERDPKSTLVYWVTCQFMPLEDGELPDGGGSPIDSVAVPTNRRAKVRWDREVFSNLAPVDKDGKVIVNPCNALYDDVLESERTRSVLVVTWNVATVAVYADVVQRYENSVNSSAWSCLGYTYGPREVLCRELALGPIRKEGAYTYYEATMRLAINEKGVPWDDKVPQLGRHYYTKSGSGFDETSPGFRKRTAADDIVPLNDDGTRRADDQPILVKAWQTRRTADFSQLPFMSLL